MVAIENNKTIANAFDCIYCCLCIFGTILNAISSVFFIAYLSNCYVCCHTYFLKRPLAMCYGMGVSISQIKCVSKTI